jgi:uncharacterized protein
MANLERPVTIPGEVELEGMLHWPEGGQPRGGVVVCHPHPRYGGNLHNAVSTALAREATAQGLAALRFNFRGTGESEGEHGEGLAEKADVAAALAFLGQELSASARLALAGYSFGAAVAAAYAADEAAGYGLAALALVALPVAFPDLEWSAAALQRVQGTPVLAVVGERDEYAPPAAVGRALAALGARGRLLLVPGADHFFEGKRLAVAGAVARFLAEHLGGSR